TWLKSRLLVPQLGEPEDAEIAADILQARLMDLQAMREAAKWMGARPQLGWDVFERGIPEELTELDRSRLKLEMAGLLSAYLVARRRAGGKQQYRPKPMVYFSVQDALQRVGRLLGSLPDWASLEQFLPEGLEDGTPRRAAISSTLIAGLEMAKSGQLDLRQDQRFGPILMRQTKEGDEFDG
ncbi:MAG: segregation/condensation protein A, partial [Rhodospirillales bacterium]|nr:segregation/condensation protein A [Rhodospirillales bacterium]